MTRDYWDALPDDTDYGTLIEGRDWDRGDPDLAQDQYEAWLDEEPPC